MLDAKSFEIRDRATAIRAIGIRLAPYEFPDGSADRYLMRRAGYGEPLVLLTKMDGGSFAEYDPNAWREPTMKTAHKYITERWSDLESGAVIDCEFIRGETSEPKVSERFTDGGGA